MAPSRNLVTRSRFLQPHQKLKIPSITSRAPVIEGAPEELFAELQLLFWIVNLC